MRIEPLSNREMQILKHFCNPNKRIAEKLNLTHFTICTHVNNINQKLCVNSKLEAIGLAIKTGMIKPKEIELYCIERE